MTFTEQKNGVKGEYITLSRSGDAIACPVLCLARRVLNLRAYNAAEDCPLYVVFDRAGSSVVTSSMITAIIRDATHGTDIPPSKVSARSLRASGATALLQAGTDVSKIKLLGRWKTDEVFRYLHTRSVHLMDGFASDMLAHS